MKKLIDTQSLLFQGIIEKINVLVIAFDTKRNILIWNRAAAAVTGYSVREAMGPTSIIERLYPDVSYRKNVIHMMVTAANVPFRDVEWVLKTKSGERRCVSWTGVSVRGANRRLMGSFLFGVDVTRHNAIKERERESFRALLKTIRSREQEKSLFEKEIVSLKAEVNALCCELSRPPRFPTG